MSVPRFTAETNILEALACRSCEGGPEEGTNDCPRCGGTGAEPKVADLFRSRGMHCWRKGDREWCIAAEKETLGEAALFHEMDLEKFLADLNALEIPTK
jgi:hypothetical protein